MDQIELSFGRIAAAAAAVAVAVVALAVTIILTMEWMSMIVKIRMNPEPVMRLVPTTIPLPWK
jgi:hypothetical protein